MRAERARAVGLFRYPLIREAADGRSSIKQRGRLMRALAEASTRAQSVTAHQTFRLLVRASQDQNRKLRDLAEELATTGTLPETDA